MRHTDDMGGDPACWLSRVCPECGKIRVNHRDETGGICEHCGAPGEDAPARDTAAEDALDRPQPGAGPDARPGDATADAPPAGRPPAS
jgi:hypothetical protein